MVNIKRFILTIHSRRHFEIWIQDDLKEMKIETSNEEGNEKVVL